MADTNKVEKNIIDEAVTFITGQYAMIEKMIIELFQGVGILKKETTTTAATDSTTTKV